MLTTLGKKNQSEKRNTNKPNRFATIPPHSLVACTCPMLRHRRSWLCHSTEGSAIHKTGSYLNRITYPTTKLHLRKCLVEPMLLKTNKFVSKFENPRSGGESPFSQQRGRFLYNLGKRFTRSSLLAVEWTAMVVQTLGINGYVSGEGVWRKCKKVRSTKGHDTGICRVRTQRRSHHRLSSQDVSVSVRACNVWPPHFPTAWTRWCISANEGFPNLAIATKLSPLPEQNNNLRFDLCIPCRHLPVKSVDGEGNASRRPDYEKRIVRCRRDMGRLISHRRSRTVDRPASGHSCRPASLHWKTWWTAFCFAPSSRSLQQCWPLRSGPAAAHCARVVTSPLSAPGPAVAVFEI